MDQFEAAREGDFDQLHRLLTTSNVDDGDPDGSTALHFSACNGHEECAKLCLEMGANVNARDNRGATPLHDASFGRHVDVARMLLDAGANVDATDRYGWTTLFFAIRANQIDIVRLLLDRGGKASTVKLINCSDLPSAIPDWVNAYIASRSRCRFAADIIIGIHKYHRTNKTGNNDINVLRLIGKHIWSTRMDDAWSQSQ
jgi:ankyrin repeat protein